MPQLSFITALAIQEPASRFSTNIPPNEVYPASDCGKWASGSVANTIKSVIQARLAQCAGLA
jgi:hypothetical protein